MIKNPLVTSMVISNLGMAWYGDVCGLLVHTSPLLAGPLENAELVTPASRLTCKVLVEGAVHAMPLVLCLPACV